MKKGGQPRRPGRVAAGGLGALALALVATFAVPGVKAPRAAAATGPTLPGTSCPSFPSDAAWNTPVTGLPVSPNSARWLAAMNASGTNLHPDYGPSGDPSNPYGIPWTVVTSSTPTTAISFQYASESDPGPYPFTSSTPIEGGPASSGDRHAIMVNASTCELYELYDAHYSSGGSTAGSGATWSLTSDALRPAGWTSADAAGLPILPLLARRRVLRIPRGRPPGDPRGGPGPGAVQPGLLPGRPGRGGVPLRPGRLTSGGPESVLRVKASFHHLACVP